MNYRRVATFTGWLWIITFVTSIPARLFFYAPVLDHEGDYVTGAGSDAQTLIGIGAVLELLLIIANVGTAVVPYSIHKRVHEAGAVAYVAARLVECTFIAIGIVGMLAISSLRQDAPPGIDAAVGQGIFAVYEWTFRIGPGVFAGIGNGLILGWLMYRSGLVPPALPCSGWSVGRWSASWASWSSWASFRPRAHTRCWWPRSSSGSWGSASISSSRATGPRLRHWRGPRTPQRSSPAPAGTQPANPATRSTSRRIAGRAGYWSWLGVALAHKALTIFQPWRVCTSWRYST
jgi:hypothetical protein